MKRLTAADIVNLIRELVERFGEQLVYEYVSGRSRLRIETIEEPEGPISFVNVDDEGKETSSRSISRRMIAKMALICSGKPDYPLHIDRIYSAGGNARSAFETLLVHTPHFFMCYPERVDVYTGEILTNLKHIMWCPDEEHSWGEIAQKEYNEVIAEVELGVDFGQITVTRAHLGKEFDSIEAKTTHTQMQVALVEIGNALNFRTWIAKNDRSIQVRNARLGDLDGVIPSLDDVKIFYKKEIKKAALLIDCIWFADEDDRIPAVIEVEHSTGVTSGLTRMLKLRETFPAISTTFTIVAPDRLRNKVVSEANQGIYRALNARFMPYSTVRELYGLIQRYALSGIVDYRFIDPFMERIIED